MIPPLRILALTLVLFVSPSFAKAPPLKPDHKLTPGVTTAISADALCAKTFHTKDERAVSAATKNAVFAEYGLPSHKPKEYEVDHLISLELGGSNDIKN